MVHAGGGVFNSEGQYKIRAAGCFDEGCAASGSGNSVVKSDPVGLEVGDSEYSFSWKEEFAGQRSPVLAFVPLKDPRLLEQFVGWENYRVYTIYQTGGAGIRGLLYAGKNVMSPLCVSVRDRAKAGSPGFAMWEHFGSGAMKDSGVDYGDGDYIFDY